jgi:hypothetical protein
MNKHGATGLTLMLLGTLALSGCSDLDDERPIREGYTRCDAGRPISFRVARDIDSATKAAVDGADGFYLFNGNGAGRDLIHVDRTGRSLETLPTPVPEGRWTRDLDVAANGEVVLAGNVGFEPNPKAWAARIDVQRNVKWDTEIAPASAAHVQVLALDDGGALAVVSDYLEETTAGPYPKTRTVSWMRIDPQGALSWRNELSYEPRGDGYWWGDDSLQLQNERMRFVLETTEGLMLVSTDLEGESTSRALDTKLAFDLRGAVGLPDGRLAVVSSRQAAILTMVDAEGEVLWEKSYGRSRIASPYGVIYNASREELLLAGAAMGASWF